MPKTLYLLASLFFVASTAMANEAVKIATQLSCAGQVEGTENDWLEVILHNQWSLADKEPSQWPNVAMVWLKSQISPGGSWFAVIPAAVAAGQSLWIYRESGERQELATGTYGAKLVLSSGKPLLEIINPGIKMEITMARGEQPDTIELAGYLAVRDSASGEALVVNKLSCSIQAAAAQE